jgi:hypothetical protein
VCQAVWSAAAAVWSGQAMTEAASSPPAIPRARFGPDSSRSPRSRGEQAPWWSAWICRTAGAGDPQDSADPLHAEGGAILGDEVPAAGAPFTSRAKQAATRRGISRSDCHSFSAFSGRVFSARNRPVPQPDSRRTRGARAVPGARFPCGPRPQRLGGDAEVCHHRRVCALAARGATVRDRVLPELLRIRRPASHLDIPPWTIKIHCQGVPVRAPQGIRPTKTERPAGRTGGGRHGVSVQESDFRVRSPRPCTRASRP